MRVQMSAPRDPPDLAGILPVCTSQSFHISRRQDADGFARCAAGGRQTVQRVL